MKAIAKAVERGVKAIEAVYDANGGAADHDELARAVIESLEPVPLNEAIELDEDTIRAVLVGGEWFPVAIERRAVGGHIPSPEGWLTITCDDGRVLIVRERDVLAVVADYRDPPK